MKKTKSETEDPQTRSFSRNYLNKKRLGAGEYSEIQI